MVTGILALATVVLAILLGWSLVRETNTQKKLASLALGVSGVTGTEKDKALDYLLRFYQLLITDPYVAKPGYDEKRCHHCHFKQASGHDPQCPWATVRPLVQRLYSAPPTPPANPLAGA